AGALCAQEDVTANTAALQFFVRYLCEGQIHLCLHRTGSIGIQPPLINMAYHADNLRIWQLFSARRIAIEVEILSDWVLAGKIFVRQSFVNDDYCRRMLVIGRSKEPATLELKLHDFEIVRFNNIFKRHCQIALVRRLGPSHEPEKILIVIFHGMSTRIERHRLNPGSGCNFVTYLSVRCANGIRRLVLVASWSGDFKGP